MTNFPTISCETIKFNAISWKLKKRNFKYTYITFDCTLREFYISILLYIITHFGIYQTLYNELYCISSRRIPNPRGKMQWQCFVFIITGAIAWKLNPLTSTTLVHNIIKVKISDIKSLSFLIVKLPRAS